MRRIIRIEAAFLVISPILFLGAGGAEEPKDTPSSASDSKLAMSPAVACRDVIGYEDYEPLPDAALTSNEKLVVYYRPTGFEITRQGKNYKTHLTQDGRIRLRGSKTIVFRKERLIDFEFKSEQPITFLYVKCIVSLKGLKPGEYDLDIILHDEIAKSAEATQTLKFKAIATAPSKDKDKDKDEDKGEDKDKDKDKGEPKRP